MRTCEQSRESSVSLAIWNWEISTWGRGGALFQRVPLQIKASRRYERWSIISLLAWRRIHSPRTNTRFVWYWTDNERSSTTQDFDGEFGNGSGETFRPGISSSRQRSFRESEEIDPRPDLEATARGFLRKASVIPSSQLNKLLRDKFTRGSIKCELHPQWGDDDKRRVYQGCSGRLIKPDEGNSYSDRFLCEGNASHTTESVFRDALQHWPGMLLVGTVQCGARFTTEIRW